MLHSTSNLNTVGHPRESKGGHFSQDCSTEEVTGGMGWHVATCPGPIGLLTAEGDLSLGGCAQRLAAAVGLPGPGLFTVSSVKPSPSPAQGR